MSHINGLDDIKGVGPKTLEKLHRNGIRTIDDLLFNFPVGYEFSHLNNCNDIVLEKTLTLEVTVTKKANLFFIRKTLDKLSFSVICDQHRFEVHIFNRRYLSNLLIPGQIIVVTGKFTKSLSHFTASNIVLRKNFKPGIKPVYRIKDVKEASLHKIYDQVLTSSHAMKEVIPQALLEKHHLPFIDESIRKIHQPETEVDIQEAKKRIIYEELLRFAIKIETLKSLNKNIVTVRKKYDISRVKAFIKTLPFELTDDQKQATNEIFKDLKQDRQMNRLLQGDVGSGKTIITVIASLAVVSAGFQVAYMAPTLVLAMQHYQTYCNLFKHENIRISLLTSAQSSNERQAIKDDIKEHQTDIIVGTHALIQDDIDFHHLGFVIIDEQHRFGVSQRRLLRQKGATPDILLMSATPIPRTLAISIYRDLDLSFIKEKPKGRLPIDTEIIAYEDLDIVAKKIKAIISEGHQAYVICPMINESESSNRLSVEETLSLMTKKMGSGYQLSMLHGKMKGTEKNQVIKDFEANLSQVLISTTVVEVGIDVPNATVMVIMNADTFGLAQLHQLRGRIGRGSVQSYCYLVVDDPLIASERIDIMTKTNDGFVISEYDLKTRGPGEVFGQLQSGIPPLKMANLIDDQIWLEKALKDAEWLLNQNDQQSRALQWDAKASLESYYLD